MNSSFTTFIQMLKNFFLTSFRKMLRHKGFTIINVTGLAIGLAACILILLFILDELSYDRFHKKSDRIYRITAHGVFGDNEFNSTFTPVPLAASMCDEFPEVEQITRLLLRPQRTIHVSDDKTLTEDRFFYADSSFFKVFSFRLIEGDPNTVLLHPGSIVLTKSAAKRYFGDEDPIGRTLLEDNRNIFTVTGIAEDIPANSHFRFNALASFHSLPWYNITEWFSRSAQTYVLISEKADPEILSENLNTLLYRRIGEQLPRFLGITLEEFRASGQSYGYDLQPLHTIHLHSNLQGEYQANGSITYVYLFSAIALFILSIACINFMNLSTARSATRSKETGIRKVLGATRSKLILQFLSEAMLYNLMAMILALLLMEISLPLFNQISGKQLSLNVINNPAFLIAVPAFILFTTLLAGLYPAFYLSSFEPLKVLKGKATGGITKNRFRSLLVLFQYSISIVLMISTLVIYRQLQYVQQKNPGYDSENLIVIRQVHGLGNGKTVFKQNILQNPDIQSAAYSIDLPGDELASYSMVVAGRPLDEVNIVMTLFADYDFLETLGMKMTEGRWFEKDYAGDTAALILNQAAIRRLGITDIEKDRILRHATPPEEDRVERIIGVVEDFHFESLHRKIMPLAIYLLPEGKGANRLPVKVHPGQISETISFLEQEWNAMESGQPFEYNLLDTALDKFYGNDKRTRIIYTAFSILALLIASLGLYGLAAFTTENRTREIGIRKAHGASVSRIVTMLSKEFTRWVLVANIIAWPVAYFLMDNWLDNFAYRISMPWLGFVVAGLLAFIIAIITVSSLAYKTANANPVEALKYE
jgi:putative ABC transport system permease protein